MKSEGMGILGLIGCVILFLILRRFVPALSTVLLIVGGILLALIVLLVVLVIVFSRKSTRKGKRDDVKTAANNEILSRGRADLLAVRCVCARIKNKEIAASAGDICRSVEQILHVMKEKPECIPTVRHFWNYYLPTLNKILQKYARIESSGIPAEEIVQSTLSCLGEIRAAMQKQHENLYEGDKLDLSVEMEVLKMMCKRDGLLSEDDFQITEEKRESESDTAEDEDNEEQGTTMTM